MKNEIGYRFLDSRQKYKKRIGFNKVLTGQNVNLE